MHWYALHVASCSEAIVCRKLADAGVESFYPHTMIQPKRARRAPYAKPVWPGYVFALFHLEERTPVVSLSMVISILGTAHVPMPIPTAEIETVRIMAQSTIAATCPYRPTAGETITIQRGPFQGSEGVVIRSKGKTHLIVSIELLQRSLSAEIDAEDCEPLKFMNSTLAPFMRHSKPGENVLNQTAA